jgi:uncharacterized protein (DUF433 family)
MVYPVRVDALRERSGVGGIERRRGILAGQPAVAGTRITPTAIRRMVADGWTVDRILEESPDLRREDVAVALAQELTAPMPEMSRKLMYASSSYALRSREPDGRARKDPDQQGR